MKRVPWDVGARYEVTYFWLSSSVCQSGWCNLEWGLSSSIFIHEVITRCTALARRLAAAV